jgi:hypothetical protein
MTVRDSNAASAAGASARSMARTSVRGLTRSIGTKDLLVRSPIREQPERPSGAHVHARVQAAQLDQAAALNAEADQLYAEGATAGTDANEYVRVTVYLATVLSLVAISGHFPIRGVRIGLIAIGVVVLAVAITTLLTLPRPPA